MGPKSRWGGVRLLSQTRPIPRSPNGDKNEQKVSMFILNFRLFKAIFFLRIGKDFPPNWDRFLKSKMEGSPNVFHQRNWPSIRKF